MSTRVSLILFLHLASSASASAQTTLAVVSAQPTGEIATLAQADEIRVRFSEPMVPIGRIPDRVDAPFFSIRPAVTGTLRWAGPTILVESSRVGAEFGCRRLDAFARARLAFEVLTADENPRVPSESDPGASRRPGPSR